MLLTWPCLSFSSFFFLNVPLLYEVCHFAVLSPQRLLICDPRPQNLCYRDIFLTIAKHTLYESKLSFFFSKKVFKKIFFYAKILLVH